MKAAREAYSAWSLSTTAKERGEILENWYRKMLEKQNELAELITLEEVSLLIFRIASLKFIYIPYFLRNYPLIEQENALVWYF